MQHTVVILGGGFAGIATAHKLLKYTKPKVSPLKVILVTRSTHHYYNVAAVRGVLPNTFTDESLFFEIAPGFQKYPEDSFDLVVGSVGGIDLNKETVEVNLSNGSRTIKYTQLVIATGSSYPSQLPFTPVGDFDKTRNAVHQLRDRVAAAESILIAGSGPTGVETAAELGHMYGGKKAISLVIEGKVPLPMTRKDIGETAARGLRSLGVELILETRVTKATEQGPHTHVQLDKGDTRQVDLYLPLFGIKPNTAFVPPHLLDDRGYIKQDPTLRAAGVTNVWAVGDVGDIESCQLIYTEHQAAFLAKNLDAVLCGKEAAMYKLSSKPQVYVTLGKSQGVGQFMSFKVPSFVVSMAKGKTMLTERGPALISGKSQ